MELSVIIVNYNVKYFLEQCLLSIRKASKNIKTEIFVVDNNSVDGSVKMLKDKFPEVILIENHDNKGFSKANNQAIELAKGKYILLLNPDTLVEDDTFVKVVDFMDKHSDAGGLGVKMIDGKGKFLPESKRGLPTPAVAFYKIFGLSKIFPKSQTFGKYHLSYLDKNKIHDVEILSGAFMLLRKTVLDKIGYLDETFFMYGEDIDLSYRIIKAGYKNYYFPETGIIHYKGESTKKSSINYVFVFYNAMIIFAKKHFSKKNANLFSFLINIAVYLRAFLSIIYRFAIKVILPFIDILLSYAGIFFIKSYWEKNFIYLKGGHYPIEFIYYVIPTYIFLWLISVYYSGGYDKPIKLIKIIQGIFIGTIAILVIYALLPEIYRFSRAIIILGAVWTIFSMLFLRIILHLSGIKIFKLDSVINKRFAIIGGKSEASRVSEIIKQTNYNFGFIGLVGLNENDTKDNDFIGDISQLNEIIEIYKISEVIFCAKDVSAQVIINKMSDLQDLDIEYKIAPPESLFIIGSKSIDTTSDLYGFDLNSIMKPHNKRNKRILDICITLSFIIFIPFLLLVFKNRLNIVKNIFLVLFSTYSWVGYKGNLRELNLLPVIKKGVLNPTDVFKNKNFDDETILKLNILYSRDYKIQSDLSIIIKGIKNIDRII